MKRYIICLLLLAASLPVFARRPQTRAFVFDTICTATLSQADKVIECFAYQFQSDPDRLFDWVFDTGGTSQDQYDKGKIDAKGKDAIYLDYKPGSYDPVAKTGDVLIDIYVLGVKWYSDTHLGTKYTRRTDNGTVIHHLDATYSGSLLEGAYFDFRLTPAGTDKIRFEFTISLTFGRVLSSFISDKTWNEVASWRMAMIARNFVRYFQEGVPGK